jgi:hypothetical protein
MSQRANGSRQSGEQVTAPERLSASRGKMDDAVPQNSGYHREIR